MSVCPGLLPYPHVILCLESAVSEDSGHLSDDEGVQSFRSSTQRASQPWPPETEAYKQLQQKRGKSNLSWEFMGYVVYVSEPLSVVVSTVKWINKLYKSSV